MGIIMRHRRRLLADSGGSATLFTATVDLSGNVIAITWGSIP